LNAITVVVYRAHHFYSSHRKENSALVITQTAIMISYTIFWCIPTILYLICYVLGFEASIFGSITMILSTGSGFFACITPFLFLWKHNEFRTFFVRFYHLQGLFKQTSVVNLGTVSSSERRPARVLNTHIMNTKVSAVTAIEFAK
uniref:G_PROTEIN_RECEP_F1_2 domain-containing protein n=1 Tax=Anisakis simplex TaxID=6269 RepID=A0A0M3KDG0_ANISI